MKLVEKPRAKRWGKKFLLLNQWFDKLFYKHIDCWETSIEEKMLIHYCVYRMKRYYSLAKLSTVQKMQQNKHYLGALYCYFYFHACLLIDT